MAGRSLRWWVSFRRMSHRQHGPHGTESVCRPADAWPWATRRPAETTRKNPQTRANRALSGGFDWSTIRAARGGQRDGPCNPWQTDPLTQAADYTHGIQPQMIRMTQTGSSHGGHG